MKEIKTVLAPKGSKCRPGYALSPLLITIHNTANTNKGAGATNHAAYLQGAGKGKAVSWHYAVDDKLITQSIPDSEVAWHAGDGGKGVGNRKSLAIEICENPESNLKVATDNAAELTAMLMQKYNIPLDNVVQHNHWSGKDCPRRLRKGEPYSWAAFLSKVAEYLQPKDSGYKPTTNGKLRLMAYSEEMESYYPRMSREYTPATYAAVKADMLTNLRPGEIIAEGY